MRYKTYLYISLFILIGYVRCADKPTPDESEEDTFDVSDLTEFIDQQPSFQINIENIPYQNYQQLTRSAYQIITQEKEQKEPLDLSKKDKQTTQPQTSKTPESGQPTHRIYQPTPIYPTPQQPYQIGQTGAFRPYQRELPSYQIPQGPYQLPQGPYQLPQGPYQQYLRYGTYKPAGGYGTQQPQGPYEQYPPFQPYQPIQHYVPPTDQSVQPTQQLTEPTPLVQPYQPVPYEQPESQYQPQLTEPPQQPEPQYQPPSYQPLQQPQYQHYQPYQPYLPYQPYQPPQPQQQPYYPGPEPYQPYPPAPYVQYPQPTQPYGPTPQYQPYMPYQPPMDQSAQPETDEPGDRSNEPGDKRDKRGKRDRSGDEEERPSKRRKIRAPRRCKEVKFLKKNPEGNLIEMIRNDYNIRYNDRDKFKCDFKVNLEGIVCDSHVIYEHSEGTPYCSTLTHSKRNDIFVINNLSIFILIKRTDDSWKTTVKELPSNIKLYGEDSEGSEIDLKREDYSVSFTSHGSFKYLISPDKRCTKIVVEGIVVWEKTEEYGYPIAIYVTPRLDVLINFNGYNILLGRRSTRYKLVFKKNSTGKAKYT
uniref:Theileria-specific sub-telomeric protein, SVSP family, putative n=1 Tax=Theileria annulata TaxID=5874 RepID=A0A3B0MQG9_THEAN